MRLTLSVIAALLFLVMVPTEAPALKLGRVLGLHAGSIDSLLRRGVRKALRPYAYRSHAYRSRARVARRAAPSRAAVARAQQRQEPQRHEPQREAGQRQVSQRQMAQFGQFAQPQAFWPGAPQDVFDYVLSSKEAGLWAHGYGAIVVSMFAQPPKAAGEGVATGEPAEQTTGAAAGGGAPLCGEHSASRAEAVTKQLRDTLALADDEGALAELHSALLRADSETTAACPRGIPAALPDRLRAMQDRLWDLRVAVTNLRAPLQAFHDALTSEQKAKLDAQQSATERESKRRAPASAGAMLCHAQTQQAPQWPAEQIARAVRPDKDQQESFGALSETSSKMGMLMMGSCPQDVPATPQARLNVALDWLDTMLFATVTVAVAVDDFYRSLSEEQKAKLDTLSL